MGRPHWLVRLVAPFAAFCIAPQSLDELVHDRRIGAACFWENDDRRAAELFVRVAQSSDATARDFLNAALAIALRDRDTQATQSLDVKEARHWLARALEVEPDLVDALVLAALIDLQEGARPHAITTLERARTVAPADPTVAALLGEALFDEGEIGRAKPLLKEAMASDACFRQSTRERYALGRVYIEARERRDRFELDRFRHREDEARRSLADVGAASPSARTVGRLAWIEPPAPAPSPGVAPSRAPELSWQSGTAIPTRGRARSIDLSDLTEIFQSETPRDDLIVTDDAGIVVARPRGDGRYATIRVAAGDWRRTLAVSLEAGLDKSLLAVGRDRFELFDPDEQAGFTRELGPIDLGAEIRDVALLDLIPDSNHALDLLFATDHGLVCFANRGYPSEHDGGIRWKSGPLRLEVASESLPGAATPCAWLVVDDFDDDGRPDLLCGGAHAPTRLLLHGQGDALQSLHENAATGIADGIAMRPLAADLDHDGNADLLLPGSPARWQRNLREGCFAVEEKLSFSWARPGVLADVDRDGEEDLVTTDEAGVFVARLGALLDGSGPFVRLPAGAPIGQPPRLADVDGDGALDLLDVHDVGVLLRLGRPDPATHALHVRLRGPGAYDAGRNASFVAYVHGRVARRFVTTSSVVLGLGGDPLPELIDVRWPSGDDVFFRREFLILDRPEQKLPWEWDGGPRHVARIYQRERFVSGPPGPKTVRFRAK